MQLGACVNARAERGKSAWGRVTPPAKVGEVRVLSNTQYMEYTSQGKWEVRDIPPEAYDSFPPTAPGSMRVRMTQVFPNSQLFPNCFCSDTVGWSI